MGEGLGVRALFACRFMAPIRVHKQVFPLHEPPHLAAADVRRLTLSQRVLREKAQSPSTGSGCTSLPAYAYGLRRASLGSYARLAWVHGPNPRQRPSVRTFKA